MSARSVGAIAWALVFFVAGQAVLAYLIDRWHPEVRYPEYGYRLAALRRRQRAAPDRPLVVALGSSRTEFGFVPGALPRCRLPDGRQPLVFNFGLGGAGPVEEILCLFRLLDGGFRPAAILVEVNPAFLYQPGRADQWLSVGQLSWRELPVVCRYSRRPAWACYGEWCRSGLVPGSTYRSNLMNWLAPTFVPYQSHLEFCSWRTVFAGQRGALGWMACIQDVAEPERRRRAVEHARWQYADRLSHFQVSEGPDRALRDLLVLCRGRHFPCLLYLMPEDRRFRGWYPPAVKAGVDAYLNGLSRQYHVPLVDCREWVADAEFCDGHHLLASGARKFSRRFGAEVLRPFLEGRLASSR